MEGLIFLLILIPLIAFVILIAILNRTSEQKRLTESLYDRIKNLSDEIAGLTKEIKNLKKPDEEKTIAPQKEATPKAAPPSPIPVIPKEEKKEEVKPVIQSEIKKTEPVTPRIEIKKEEPGIPKKDPPKIIVPTSKQNTDLEKFIGENLLNKIGIAVLVLGISFFVKYAIDKDWINETGRVIIGFIAGGILLGIAHRFRNSYRSFSSVLVGGGLTVFYFTIAFAFHQYELIGQKTAFGGMLIVTAMAVLLSLYYDRFELAILATIGGFVTPFLVRGDHENYLALFTYLSILNAGLMALAWFKRWHSINIIALFFTVLIYGGWLINLFWTTGDNEIPYKNALLFDILFYIQFIVMSILNNIRLKRSFAWFDFLIVLSVNFLFYIAGIFILDYWNDGKYNGLFTVLLGLFNLSLVIGFKQKRTIDKNFIGLLTGLAITFISLSVPIQFKGNEVTLFWAAESVILFWLYGRTRIKQLKIASLFLSILMMISLVISWSQVYFSDHLLIPVLLNKGFSTSIAVAASLFIYYKLMYKEGDTYYLTGITNQSIRNTFFLAFIITLYVAGALEFYYQFISRVDPGLLYLVYLQLYTFLFTVVILIVFRKTNIYSPLKLLLTILCLALYLLNIQINYDTALKFINTKDSYWFHAHWIASILLCWLMLDVFIYFKKHSSKSWETYLPSITWLFTGGLVVLLTAEMFQANLWLNYSRTDWFWWLNLSYKAGLTILWSISSFVMMWLGMQYKFRPLRIISLTLFTITLVKLFVYDIRNIPPGGKIAAFILLGVLLLTVSFMYQRLKKIIIDDPNSNLQTQ